MASELSRLIDDELDKVERQQRGPDGEPARSTFEIKGQGLQHVGSALSWRDRAWWTRNRIILALVAILLLIITILLLFPNSSSSTKSDALMSPGSFVPKTSTDKEGSTLGTVMGPTLGFNSSGDQGDAVAAPGPGGVLTPAPSLAPKIEGPSPTIMGPELAPLEAEAPSIRLSNNASTPAPTEGNSTESSGEVSVPMTGP